MRKKRKRNFMLSVRRYYDKDGVDVISLKNLSPSLPLTLIASANDSFLLRLQPQEIIVAETWKLAKMTGLS